MENDREKPTYQIDAKDVAGDDELAKCAAARDLLAALFSEEFLKSGVVAQRGKIVVRSQLS